MIRVEKEEVEIKGCAPEVMAEATLLMRKIRGLLIRSNGEECAEKMVHSIFVLSSKSDDEIEGIIGDFIQKVSN